MSLNCSFSPRTLCGYVIQPTMTKLEYIGKTLLHTTHGNIKIGLSEHAFVVHNSHIQTAQNKIWVLQISSLNTLLYVITVCFTKQDQTVEDLLNYFIAHPFNGQSI